MAALGEGLARIADLGLDLVLSVFILATVFALLAAGERFGSRWRQRKQRRLTESLRENGLSQEQLQTLAPFIDYVAKHDTPVKPLIGLAASVSLAFLSLRASNTTFLATSYGITAAGFVLLSAIEVVRYHRARRIDRALHARPDQLIASGDSAFPFAAP